MLLIIFLQFMSLTITSFSLLFEKHKVFNMGKIFVLYGMMTLIIANVVAIDCSANISEKSKDVNLLLYQLMIKDKTNQLLSNEGLQLNISKKREVDLRVCGFFNMDYTLIHSMVAAVSAYLVVMLQFI